MNIFAKVAEETVDISTMVYRHSCLPYVLVFPYCLMLHLCVNVCVCLSILHSIALVCTYLCLSVLHSIALVCICVSFYTV